MIYYFAMTEDTLMNFIIRITGMGIASQLPKNTEITILGDFLPGDAMDQRYVSQWAGAIWLGVHDSTPWEQGMQLNSFSELWRIAE